MVRRAIASKLGVKDPIEYWITIYNTGTSHNNRKGVSTIRSPSNIEEHDFRRVGFSEANFGA